MGVPYVWIFDHAGAVTGIWVNSSLARQSSLPETVKMAVVARRNSAEAAGRTPDDIGFGIEIYATVAERRWRHVRNGRTEVGSGNAFSGGAFLMFGNAPAPNEVQEPHTAYEVRQTDGAHALIQIRPVRKRKAWWSIWSNRFAEGAEPDVVPDTTTSRAVAAPSEPAPTRSWELSEDLITSLRDPDPNVRRKSIEMIGGYGKDVVYCRNASVVMDLLAAALKDEDHNTAAAAAWAIGEIGDATKLEPLELLAQSENIRAKSEAAAAIKKLLTSCE